MKTYDEEFAKYIKNDKHRFTSQVIPQSDEDTTTDIFYDDVEEKGENNSVCVTEYFTIENGIQYSVQIPHCNIWMSEEMLMRVSMGMLRAREKILRKRNENA